MLIVATRTIAAVIGPDRVFMILYLRRSHCLPDFQFSHSPPNPYVYSTERGESLVLSLDSMRNREDPSGTPPGHSAFFGAALFCPRDLGR